MAAASPASRAASNAAMSSATSTITMLGTKQGHRLPVPRHERPIPVSGAVDRELRDGAIGDIGAEKLTAVPRLTVLIPLLLDLEHEAGRRRVEARARDAALRRMPGGAQGCEVVEALRLQPPLRHAEVTERVGGERALGNVAGLEERVE